MGKYFEKYVYDFLEADSKKVKEQTQQLIKKMMELMVESDFNEIEQLLNDCKVMRYKIQGYLEETKSDSEEKNMLTNVGYTMALIDAMQLYKEKVYMQYEIQKVNTKYRDILLRILAERGTLLHKDLAICLGVSPSGLNAIIKQMNATSVKLINVETVSKYKMYSITAIALKYINKCLLPTTPKEENPISKKMIFTYQDEELKYVEERIDLDKGKEYIQELERINLSRKGGSFRGEEKVLSLNSSSAKYKKSIVVDYDAYKKKWA